MRLSIKFPGPAGVALVPLAAVLLSFACTDLEPVAPAVVPPNLGPQQVIAGGAVEVLGEAGGALYAMYVPDAWNGSLVLYAHGYNSAAEPLTLDDENLGDIRAGLNDLGYAVAYSSWSENGWAVTDGIRHTHQLLGLFTARFQRPNHVYLVGRSLGSLVATSLAETHPEQYDGVLPVCGFLGGTQMYLNYLFNIRLLFNLYYPGVIPGDPTEPPVIDLETLLGLAQQAMILDPSGAVHIAEAMAAIGMPIPAVPGQPVTLVVSILNALGAYTSGGGEYVERTHGHMPFDNWDTDYVIAEVQAGMPRYHGDPDALNYAQRAYQPTGELRIPMLSLENEWDPVAPGFHRDRYEQLLAERSAQDLWVRISLASYSHCPSTGAPTIAAVQQLAAWVETGIHP